MGKTFEHIVKNVETEFLSASKKFEAFASTHEGFAIIKEELDELWDCIKNKNCGLGEMEKEAIQVCAMAIRFIFDLCQKTDKGEK